MCRVCINFGVVYGVGVCVVCRLFLTSVCFDVV